LSQVFTIPRPRFTVDGLGLASGTDLHGTVAPPLPYRINLDIVLDECIPERRLAATVHGDLEGRAVITFEGDETERTRTRRGRWR
jgi:hypothetical protein